MSLIRVKKMAITSVKKNLGYLQPQSQAKKMGLSQRKDRKFTISALLLGTWKLLSSGLFSYDCLADQLSFNSSKTITGRGVWKRLTAPLMNSFVKKLLEKSLKKKSDTFIESALFKPFNNVFIQDATHYKLPSSLASFFPGSHSKTGKSATAKIQAVFNLTQGIFVDFDLGSFRDNDQKDAPRFIKNMEKKDLIIRDLGYFVLGAFDEIIKADAFFLSRLKYNINIYDLIDNQELNLLNELKKKGFLDTWVRLGAKNKTKCRLIAVPLSEQVTNERRRKAKNDRSSTANHSQNYMDLLGYSLYITNVPADIWSIKQVAEAYRCRWYIEILFKGWKSHLRLQINIPERYMNKDRAEFFFYTILLMVTLLVMPIFVQLQIIAAKKKKAISILRLCTFIRCHMRDIIHSEEYKRITQRAIRFCTYKKCKNRINLIERMYFIEP